MAIALLAGGTKVRFASFMIRVRSWLVKACRIVNKGI